METFLKSGRLKKVIRDGTAEALEAYGIEKTVQSTDTPEDSSLALCATEFDHGDKKKMPKGFAAALYTKMRYALQLYYLGDARRKISALRLATAREANLTSAAERKQYKRVKDAVKNFSAFAAHKHPETWGRFCDNPNLLTMEAVWK